MPYKCPKCGVGAINTADENWDWSIDDDEFPPGKCSKCGWKYKYRWHDNPNLPSTEFIALCIVLILLFYFW